MNPIKQDIANEVLKIVSDVTSVSIEDIKSKNRVTPLSSARQMYCACMCALPVKYSLAEIGLHVNVDHATVLHSKRIVPDYCFTEITFKNKYEEICERVKQSPVIASLISLVGSGSVFLTADELRAAIELITAKIQTLNDWLARHPQNNYRTKILMDVRDSNRELNAKQQQLEDLEHDMNLNNQQIKHEINQ